MTNQENYVVLTHKGQFGKEKREGKEWNNISNIKKRVQAIIDQIQT